MAWWTESTAPVHGSTERSLNGSRRMPNGGLRLDLAKEYTRPNLMRWSEIGRWELDLAGWWRRLALAQRWHSSGELCFLGLQCMVLDMVSSYGITATRQTHFSHLGQRKRATPGGQRQRSLFQLGR
jgi:hypothetical protein